MKEQDIQGIELAGLQKWRERKCSFLIENPGVSDPQIVLKGVLLEVHKEGIMVKPIPAENPGCYENLKTIWIPAHRIVLVGVE